MFLTPKNFLNFVQKNILLENSPKNMEKYHIFGDFSCKIFFLTKLKKNVGVKNMF